MSQPYVCTTHTHEDTAPAVVVPQIAVGSTSFSGNLSAWTQNYVSFPAGRFTAAPQVSATWNQASPPSGTNGFYVAINGVTTAGCYIGVRTISTTSTTLAVSWIAANN